VFTSTITGLISGDQATVTYSVRNSAGQIFTNCINLPAGDYTIIPAVSAALNTNYNVIIQTGTLYVNPYGMNAKQVKPSLDCVTRNSDGSFTANFSYTNPNSVDVVVPAGSPDNYFILSTGAVIFANGTPPERFKVGCHKFSVRFNGVRITYSLSTFNKTQKSASTSSASSTSNRCWTSSSNTTATSEAMGAELIGQVVMEKVYPNPFMSVIRIDSKAQVLNEKDVRIIDLMGREIKPASVRKTGVASLEIQTGDLPKGQYYIRVNTVEGTRIYQVTKQ
jgi:hypothetical protein